MSVGSLARLQGHENMVMSVGSLSCLQGHENVVMSVGSLSCLQGHENVVMSVGSLACLQGHEDVEKDTVNIDQLIYQTNRDDKISSMLVKVIKTACNKKYIFQTLNVFLTPEYGIGMGRGKQNRFYM